MIIIEKQELSIFFFDQDFAGVTVCSLDSKHCVHGGSSPVFCEYLDCNMSK